MDLEAEWRLYSADEPQPEDIKCIADDPGEDWLNNYHEKLDRFYAQQLVTKLEGIIDRVSALDPVKTPHVSRLFRAAHDAFLFGFDAATIALCRCLLVYALKDRLPGTRGKTLKALIPLAGKTKVLTWRSLGDAQTVQRAEMISCTMWKPFA